ncbi:uncharacterized protein LOC9640759 [Selaginella moellendorffii]|uniref:uncharacterized protein LOC9640759 n=1 Tax=Selaginella moellendorffii TaxID=88036 RepID=UPI000D1CD11A|nr:uncharacterized protein LOC9640759 [Selaginella moellendorffii]|eukprot:XP_024515542.1 uncharacterized protein LOC9640759 [Selaginella moellendorffii]
MPALMQQLNARAWPPVAPSSWPSSRALWNHCGGGAIGLNVNLVQTHSRETRIWQRSSSFARLLAAAAVDTKWLLEPIGDGDCRHIGEEVPLPSAFELSTDAATVGRVADKADIVIPVGTVSGLHARLEKRDSMLMVTDLDSTNGTFVNNRRVRPGAVTPVPPGSSITFGDEHLAQFKVSMIEKGEENTESIYIEAQFTEAED